MNGNGWAWANLSAGQMDQLLEGERTLGADILLAYAAYGSNPVMGKASQVDLEIASLDESQVECLQGLEKNMQSVVVAYRKSG
jgi:hypothetical protein